MMNKSVCATADITIKTKIQAFANSLNSTPLANVIQAKFIEHAKTYITSAGKVTVDSYHGRNRLIIPDCLGVNGDLRPTSGEAAADHRPAGTIQYVKLSSDIKFTEVDDKNVHPYPFTFYVRLTMDDITVQDENQNDINLLLTFHGEDEWATDPLQDEIDIVLKTPPSIADVSANASIEVTPGVQGLEKLALEAAWDYITQAVFNTICPNFTQDPAAVIQEITQEQVDSKTGERISFTIEYYHNAILNCASFFPQSEEWGEFDVVQHFMTHLLSSIKIQVKAIPFTYISNLPRKAPFQQMIWLQKAFSAASTAEATLDQVWTIAQQEYTMHHALHSNIKVNASVAERTISKPRSCLLICPKANEPGATERCQKGRETFNSMIKKKRSSSNNSNNGGGKRSFAAMFAKHTKDMSEDKIKSFFTSHSPQKPKKVGNDSNMQCFSISVYAASSGGAKEFLPITIDPMLPHFMIGVGPVGQTPSLSLLAAYNTAAVANIGWSDFHLAFAKKFPSAVKSITWAKKEKYTLHSPFQEWLPTMIRQNRRHYAILPGGIPHALS
eukprot:scaffold36813_cov66-Attheya_sp.AAC.6